MKRLIALPLICVTLWSSAQKATETTPSTEGKQRVLIVPFEPKMYRSSLDQSIAHKEDKDHDHIREEFRKGVAFNIDLESNRNTETVTLVKLDTSEEARDLEYIYASIGYDFVPLIEDEEEVEQEETGVDKLRGKLKQFGKKEEEKKEAGTRVEEGEIVSRPDTREKYIRTKVVNPDLLRNLKEKYAVDKVIFVGELDLTYSGSAETYAVGSRDKQVRIKIHYTVFDVEGDEIASGAAISFFTDQYQSQREIIQVHMQESARAIVKAAGI